jgi:lipoyl(octanoyl) transferase
MKDPPVTVMDWITSEGITPYADAEKWLGHRVALVSASLENPCIWLAEHPADSETTDVSAAVPDGVRVVYVVIDGNLRFTPDDLQTWLIMTLDQLNIRGRSRAGCGGIWVERPERLNNSDGSVARCKIADWGFTERSGNKVPWISINIEPDIALQGTLTSLVDMGHPVTFWDVDVVLRVCFFTLFSDLSDGAAMTGAV